MLRFALANLAVAAVITGASRPGWIAGERAALPGPSRPNPARASRRRADQSRRPASALTGLSAGCQFTVEQNGELLRACSMETL